MIEIKDLNKSFQTQDDKITIYNDLNLTVDEGKFISVMGPSGTGKTTFLNMLSGLDNDYQGLLKIGGTQIKNLSKEKLVKFRGENIGYIFQDFNLIDNLSVEENILLPVQINDLELNYDLDEILNIVGLSHKKNQFPFNLSGGEKQRVAIARAFIGKYKLLLADEPTGNLDQKNSKNIIDTIVDLQKKTGTTIVMITHDPSVAKIADESYVLDDHKLVKS